MRLNGFEPCLFDTRDELRTGAKHGNTLSVNRVEKHLALISEGRAVIQNQRCTAGKTRHQPVPHHPAAGGEVEQGVLWPNITVQLVFLQVLNKRPASPMHNTLGHAGRSRGVHDVKRMVERQLFKRDVGDIRLLVLPV